MDSDDERLPQTPKRRPPSMHSINERHLLFRGQSYGKAAPLAPLAVKPDVSPPQVSPVSGSPESTHSILRQKSSFTRTRTTSTSSSTTATAASSLAFAMHHLPVTVFFPHKQDDSGIHPLLPAPYMSSHLAVLATRNPLRESYERARKAKNSLK